VPFRADARLESSVRPVMSIDSSSLRSTQSTKGAGKSGFRKGSSVCRLFSLKARFSTPRTTSWPGRSGARSSSKAMGAFRGANAS